MSTSHLDPVGGDWYDLPADINKIFSRYRVDPRELTPLRQTFAVMAHCQADRCLLETGYIDSDFRDELANFYIRTYREIPGRCDRLHFFRSGKETQEYLGFTVL